MAIKTSKIGRSAALIGVAGLILAAPAIAAPVFMEKNTNRWGATYKSFQMARPSAKLCASACAGDAQCLAWSYNRPGTADAKAVCELKDEVTPATTTPCCDSGVRVGTGRHHPH